MALVKKPLSSATATEGRPAAGIARDAEAQRKRARTLAKPFAREELRRAIGVFQGSCHLFLILGCVQLLYRQHWFFRV